ncbi:MAG: hypothetical protein IJ168_04940 [Eubacterium sp.]|nr:hypothetical protein [Eubacterium sp.]
MKCFRKIVAIIVTISLLCSISVGFSGCSSNTNDGALTRGAWITALAEKMGLDEYQSDANYFRDIKSDNPIFSYVQSSYEWGVLDHQDSPYFYEDFKAKKGFIAETIVRASTLLDNDSATEDEIIACAIENGLLSSKKEANQNAKKADVDGK